MQFLKDTFTSIGGIGIAQGISLLFVPLVTRLFSPAEYGEMAVVMSVSSIVVPISLLKLEEHLLVSSNDREVENLLSTIIGIIAVGMIVVVLASVALAVGFEEKNILFIPVLIFFGSTSLVLRSLSLRRGRFHQIASSDIALGLSVPCSRILFGYTLSGSSFWLLMGYVVGSFISLLPLLKSANKYMKNITLPRLNGKSMKGTWDCIKRYKEYTVKQTLAALAFTANKNVMVFCVAYFYGGVEAGLYSMAIRLVESPVNLLAVPFRNVFYSHAAKKKRNGNEYFTLLARVVIFSAILGLPIIMFASFYAGDFIVFLLGDAWSNVKEITGVMFIWGYFHLLSSPGTSVYLIEKNNGRWLAIQLMSFVITLMLIVFGMVMEIEFVSLVYMVFCAMSTVRAYIVIETLYMAYVDYGRKSYAS